jgi:hypothetical protein
MDYPDDFEAYQKGYEAAIRAAGNPLSGAAARGARRRANAAVNERGGEIQRGLGFAFGWLILFPVFFALVGGSVGWVVGLGFVPGALFFGLIAFAFAVFAGAALVGWRLFVAFWPVVIVAVVVFVVATKLL